MTFELDAIELRGAERCEVRGRWFGVRGRRFMRPALTLIADGRPIRLLADLEDKPWAAEDGAPWGAAFPYPADPGNVSAAELTVGPDVTVTLPAPLPRTATRRRRAAGQAQPPRPRGDRRPSAGAEIDARSEAYRLQQQLQHLEGERVRASARIDQLAGELDDTRQALERALADGVQLTAALDAVRGERDRMAADLDRLGHDLDQAVTERDAASQAAGEAQRLRAAADSERDQAATERDRALAIRDQTASERDAALVAAQRAASERDAANAGREAATVARDQALAEQTAATARLEEARAQRDASALMAERLQAELAGLLSARGAALVMRRAAQESGTARTRAAPVLAATAALITATIVVLFVVHVL